MPSNQEFVGSDSVECRTVFCSLSDPKLRCNTTNIPRKKSCCAPFGKPSIMYPRVPKNVYFCLKATDRLPKNKFEAIHISADSNNVSFSY